MAAAASPKMKYVPLGNTGVVVSELCLGAMTFGTKTTNSWGMPTADEPTSHKILDRFVEWGGNFIDTADIYGDSESVIGRWMAKKKRDDFIIATKVRSRTDPGPNSVGLSRKHILAAVERSLSNLQTSYIDLYQIHAWDIATPIEETLRTLNDLVRVGKVRYIGVSNYVGWQLQKALDYSKYSGLEAFITLQPQYHLLERGVEYELLPISKNENLTVLPWSPLAGGWLSGKFKRGDKGPEADSRIAWAEKAGWRATSWEAKAKEEHTWRVLDALHKVANETGRSCAQVALRWLRQRDGAVVVPIIGARRLEQLEDNLNTVTFTLSPQQIAELDAASAPPALYPYDAWWLKGREIVLVAK